MRIILAILVTAMLAGCTDVDEQAPEEIMEPQGPQTGNMTIDEVHFTVNTTGTYPLNPGYDVERIEVMAGVMVNLTLINNDGNTVTQHDWVVDGIQGAQTDAIAPGAQTTITFLAPDMPGEYTFYCSIGDHADRGMTGTFVVL